MDKEQKGTKGSWEYMELLEKSKSVFDWKLTLLAMLLSVLFHFFIYASVPKDFLEPSPKEDYTELELEILPPPLKIKKLPEYIEANPYANKEKPKDTATKESFQDQRAADMIVDVDSDSDKPYVEGETPDSQKIVSGTLEDKPKAVEAMEILEIMNRELKAPSQTETNLDTLDSLEQAEDFKGDSQSLESKENSAPVEGDSTSISVKDGGESALEDVFSSEQMEEVGDIKVRDSDLKDFSQDETKSKNLSEKHSTKGDSQENIDSQASKDVLKKEASKPLPKPKSRPTIDMKVISGPLVDNNRRASILGIVAVDSSFSEFGAYQQRMIEAIARQWNLLAEQFSLSNIANTVVVVEFYLNSDGSLTSFRINYSNSSEIGKSLCEQSIKSTAPYGKWTEDMRAVFGDIDQAVKITFHYR